MEHLAHRTLVFDDQYALLHLFMMPTTAHMRQTVPQSMAHSRELSRNRNIVSAGSERTGLMLQRHLDGAGWPLSTLQP